jgi:hypothetical protein
VREFWLKEFDNSDQPLRREISPTISAVHQLELVRHASFKANDPHEAVKLS